ncbi:MAG: hypothetical protein ACI4SR_03225 [Faecalibacillus sp.]
MAHITFNEKEKIKICLIKYMLKLSLYWKKEIQENQCLLYNFDQLKQQDILKIQNRIFLYTYNLYYLKKILEQSQLTEDEINILKDVYIKPIGNLEKVGQKYYYSESGLRNKVNIILKKILMSIEK